MIMSQTNTNASVGASNTNQNQNTGRGWGLGLRGRKDNLENISIAKYSFEGKMKDGCISKLTITKTGYQAT